MVPSDPEAELSVLAEIADPLHHDLSWVTAAYFYDRRHIRLLNHIRGVTMRVPISSEDLAYLENLVTYAWPITKSLLESFVDCHTRRVRLAEIDAERLELIRMNPDKFPPGAVEAEMDRIEAIERRELLDDVAAMVRRYVMADPEQIDTITLWIVHTHALDAFYTTGRLYITSPEANCGKSVALSVIGALAAYPMMTVNISPAAMYRSMEKHTPTFLIDEIDKSITAKGAKDSEATSMLLSVLNSGYRRGITVPRCVGPKNSVQEFPTFAPVALAGILAGVDQPFMSRSIPILLQRASGTDVEELELDFEVVAEFDALKERIVSWAAGWYPQIATSKPERPDGLAGRNAEIWMPLLRIADVGGWLERAHAACEGITLFEAPGAETREWEMLRDTEMCFRLDDEGFLPTNVLIERLHNLEDSDWQNWSRGRGLSSKSLSKLLAQYGVRPVVRQRDGEQRRGYEVDGKLGNAWMLYVDPIEDAKKAAETAISLSSLSLFSLSPPLLTTTSPVAVNRDGRDPEVDTTDMGVDTTDMGVDTTDEGLTATTDPDFPSTDPSHVSTDPDFPSPGLDLPSTDDFPDVEPF